MRRSQIVEACLLVCGVYAAALVVGPGVRAALAEHRAAVTVASSELEPENRRQAAASTEDGPIVPDGEISGTYLAGGAQEAGPARGIGVLKVPALQLMVPVISGIDKKDLLLGVGHVPGSGYAGGLGNMAVAGHRDTYFRPLRSIAKGMDVLVSGPNGVFRYRVDRTEVVKPDQLHVLDVGNRPELTLITCYPFNYLGAAPERFVVHALLVSAAPESAWR